MATLPFTTQARGIRAWLEHNHREICLTYQLKQFYRFSSNITDKLRIIINTLFIMNHLISDKYILNEMYLFISYEPTGPNFEV